MDRPTTTPFVTLAGLALAVFLGGRASPAAVHVDSRATGANDGTSWANAFVHLEDALLVPGPVEIWVAAGSYAPAGPGGDRNAAFRFVTGQALYGGFRGTETTRNGRDPSANPSVLTGDLNGDDLPGFENSAENSYHVLRCKDSDATAIVDGFIVRGGSAREASGFNSAGGGVLIQNASPRFIGCRFEACFARSGATAVVLGGGPSFAGCTFRGNMVQNGRGGAVSIGGSGSAAFTSCVFEDNLVRGGVGAVDGGAIFVDLGAGATVSGCTFERNTSTSSSRSIVATGGAISSLGAGVVITSTSFRSNLANIGGAVWTAKDIVVDNCIFDRNQAIVGDGAFNGGGVGGGLVAFGAAVAFSGCTSVANEADDGGGLYSADGASIAVTNCILWASRDASGTTAQAQIKGPGSKTIQYSCVQNLFASGSYPTCIEADPLFMDADGPDNAPGTADDNLRLLAGSPCIDAGNNAAIPAGTTADIDGGSRRRDEPATPDTGSGTAPIVDMGAHEYPGASGSGTVSVASGAAFTASTAVSLTLSASGGAVTRMAFSNDRISWTAWEAFGTSKSWNLTAGDGTKTAFARFGNTTGSILAEAFDSIVFDTTPPRGTIAIAGGAATTTDAAVTLSLTATDGGSGVSTMRLSDDGAVWASWRTFSPTVPWTLPGNPGTKTVFVQFMDFVGNASASFSDTIELIAPVTATVVIDGGAAFTGSTSVSMALTVSGGVVASMAFSNDGAVWTTPEPFAASKAWVLSPGEGSKIVRARFYDAGEGILAEASDSIVLDVSPPTGSIAIEGGAATTTKPNVILTLAAADAGSGVSQMRFSNDNAAWSAWEAFAGTKSWTLPDGDGPKTVYAEFQDGAGNISAASSAGITLDTSLPTGSIAINSGAPFTKDPAVVLELAATDPASSVSQMRFSDDNATWSVWEAFAATKPWTLPAGDGPKTVYVEFRDLSGNISMAYSAAIILDRVSPSGSVAIDSGAPFTKDPAVVLGLSATDAGSGVSQVRLSDNKVSWSAWEAFAGTKPWTLPAGDGPKTVYAEFLDGAGNISAAYSDGITLDTAPPTGSFAINGGAPYANDPAVVLTLTATDAGSGVSQMRFSNDNVSWNPWEAYGSTKAWTLPGGNGPKTVYAEFQDAAGNISAASSAGITLDTSLPTGSITINGGAPFTNDPAVVLELAATDPASSVSQMRFSDDNAAWSVWEAFAATKPWTLPAGDGPKTVYVQFRDPSGNASTTYSAVITLDTAPPGGSIAINSGAPTTNDPAVVLTVSATDAGSGVSEMRFSDDNVSWSVWEAFAATKAWTLPGSDGLKTVYVEFQDGAGNASPAFSGQIVLARQPTTLFIRGDSSADGKIDLTDSIFTLSWLFMGGAAPSCLDAADNDDSASIDITDPIYLLMFLFLGGSAPPPPFGVPSKDCGPDPKQETLSCEGYLPCQP